MFPFAFGLLTEPLLRFARPLLIALAVGGVVLIGWQAWQTSKLRAERDALRVELAEQRAEWEAASAMAAALALEIQARMQQEVDNARTELDAIRRVLRQREATIRALTADIERLSADARGLRDDLARFAAGPAAGDSLAACQQRSLALAGLLAEGGELVAEGAGLVAACAIAHDERAAEVRALLGAWPRID